MPLPITFLKPKGFVFLPKYQRGKERGMSTLSTKEGSLFVLCTIWTSRRTSGNQSDRSSKKQAGKERAHSYLVVVFYLVLIIHCFDLARALTAPMFEPIFRSQTKDHISPGNYLLFILHIIINMSYAGTKMCVCTFCTATFSVFLLHTHFCKYLGSFNDFTISAV